MSPQTAARSVSATPEALELAASLVEKHGPIAFFHPGGDWEGIEPICLTRAELLPNPDEIRIGEIGGAPIYVEWEQYERWGHPEFEIDVAKGPARGLCLEGLEELHFVTRAPGRMRRLRRWANSRAAS